MVRRFWAAFERIVPRGLLAAATITAAAVTNPHAIGLYSWAALILTFYSALTDLPIRHVAAISITSSRGRKFLRCYTLLSGAVGLIFMTAAVWIIAALFGTDSATADFLNLAPLASVPLARAIAVRPTARFQQEGLWGSISLYRLTAALSGAAIGLPIVLASKSIVGACTAIAISELTYTAIICSSLARIRPEVADEEPGATPQREATDRIDSYWSTYCHMTLYTALGWFQSQAERGLLGLWAGTSALGIYSFGSAVGRSAGDAIAVSQPNVLRVELIRGEARCDEEIRRILGRNIRGGLLLTVANAIAVVIVSVYVLPPFLDGSWSTALQMGPILGLSAIPLVVAASSAPVHIQRGKARVAYIAPGICLSFAPIVALAAIDSLTLAAWLVLLRECVLAISQSLLLGRATPWREVFLAIVAVSVGAIAVLLLPLS